MAQRENRAAAFGIPSPGFDPELLRSLDPDDGHEIDDGEDDDAKCQMLNALSFFLVSNLMMVLVVMIRSVEVLIMII